MEFHKLLRQLLQQVSLVDLKSLDKITCIQKNRQLCLPSFLLRVKEEG